MPKSISEIVTLAQTDEAWREVAILTGKCVELIDERNAARGQLKAVIDERDAARLRWALAYDDGSADAGTPAAAFRNLRRNYGDAEAQRLVPPLSTGPAEPAVSPPPEKSGRAFMSKPTKTERVTIEIVVFRDDGGGSQDMDAVWNNLSDALYQIRGVELVSVREREVVGEVDDSQASQESET